MTHNECLKLLTFLLLGSLLGLTYLGALSWNVRLYCRRSSHPVALSIHAVRFLGTAAVFVAIARTGAASLLSTLAGFQFVRIFVLRAKRLSQEVMA
jgi:F1F0 ATPase subunit 2